MLSTFIVFASRLYPELKKPRIGEPLDDDADEEHDATQTFSHDLAFRLLKQLKLASRETRHEYENEDQKHDYKSHLDTSDRLEENNSIFCKDCGQSIAIQGSVHTALLRHRRNCFVQQTN